MVDLGLTGLETYDLRALSQPTVISEYDDDDPDNSAEGANDEGCTTADEEFHEEDSNYDGGSADSEEGNDSDTSWEEEM